jgi:two-component system phosphate regulon sensor histidine kinase PhoR
VLFQRFRRGDSHRARGKWGKGGYGLGLAIARKIVLDAGGDILLHPSDAGAVFEVLLPRKD